jgi:mannitol-specific phosphotransferase system IIBC component
VTNYPGRMKAFWVYTGLRLLLFVASFGIVFSAWLLIAGEANVLIAVVIAFVVSGIGSYFLLERQRQALAQHVEDRASRATARFDELKAKEDVD